MVTLGFLNHQQYLNKVSNWSLTTRQPLEQEHLNSNLETSIKMFSVHFHLLVAKLLLGYLGWLKHWNQCYTPVNQHSWLENGPGWKMYFVLKTGIFQPAMSVFQRIDPTYFNRCTFCPWTVPPWSLTVRPWTFTGPKRRGSSSDHHFSGANCC